MIEIETEKDAENKKNKRYEKKKKNTLSYTQKWTIFNVSFLLKGIIKLLYCRKLSFRTCNSKINFTY